MSSEPQFPGWPPTLKSGFFKQIPGLAPTQVDLFLLSRTQNLRSLGTLLWGPQISVLSIETI